MGNKFARRRSQIDERYTRLQGLYQHKDVDHKKLRRLILDSKVAPCYPGAEDGGIDLDECSICFLHYPSLNRSKCCTKGICTECFLQVKAPNSVRPTQCPFCKTPNYSVEYFGAKTLEEKGVEQAEEQKVIEAKIRIRRQQEIEDEKARLQRLEQAIEEGSPVVPAQNNEQQGSVPEERLPDQPLRPERSWDAWANPENSTAIGYPQSEVFSTRQNVLSSTSARNFALSRRGVWGDNSSSAEGPGYPPYSRDEDFDLDLEDIMVMEAIWLSIQQGNQRPMENISEQPFPSTFTGSQYAQDSLDLSGIRGRRGSVTGGFASAIAALAERQVTGSTEAVGQAGEGDAESTDSGAVSNALGTSETQSLEEQERLADEKADKSSMDASGAETKTMQMSATLSTTGSISNEMAAAAAATTVTNNNENLTRWIRRGMSVEASPDALLDQGSEVVEAGTSFCSSVPSAAELLLPWEDHPEGNSGAAAGGSALDEAAAPPSAATGTTGIDPAASTPAAKAVPESFEEQMMLAMALSLAEAQALQAPQNNVVK